MLIEASTAIPVVLLNPIGFLVELLFALPSVYFSYAVSTESSDMHILKLAAGTVAATILFTTVPGLYVFLRDWDLEHLPIQTFIAWPLALLVFLPFITRLAAPLKEFNPQSSSTSETGTSSIQLGRRLVGPVIGLTVILAPYLTGLTLIGGEEVSFVSPFFVLEQFQEFGIIGPATRLLIHPNLLLYFPLFVLSFLFALWVIRYCVGNADRNVAFAIGVLNTVVTWAVMYYNGGWPFFYYAALLLPVPALLVVGTLILLLVKPLVPIEDIWMEES
ncbi:MAG: hypothetical protein ACXAEN_18575 [Candidatus Thorarchaeota archaeon]|jgi:hypothetical protein